MSRSKIILTPIIVVMSLLSFVLYRDGVTFVISVLLGGAMLIVITSDFRHFIIPDFISLPLVPAGVVVAAVRAPVEFWPEAAFEASLGAVVGFGLFWLVRVTYRRLRDREGLGMGDVKLMAVAGAWTGFAGINMVILIAGISALAAMLLLYFSGHKIRSTTAVPFGAFLAFAIWVTWSLQQADIVDKSLL